MVGTRNLVDAARAAGVQRIAAQSIAFGYEDGPGPATEDTPLRPDLLGVPELESAVAELPEWVVLRYGLFYGPGTWYAADAVMADRARAGELVADESVTSFLHIDDAAAAAVAALDWPAGAVNICDDEPAPGREWVPAFCAAVGAPLPPHAVTRTPDARGADNNRAPSAGLAPGAALVASRVRRHSPSAADRVAGMSNRHLTDRPHRAPVVGGPDEVTVCPPGCLGHDVQQRRPVIYHRTVGAGFGVDLAELVGAASHLQTAAQEAVARAKHEYTAAAGDPAVLHRR